MTRAFVPYPFSARHHDAAVPPLENGVECRRHAVAILGAGPVGMATALGLARHGVACVVIEADATVCFGSRATCVSRRSLEILDRLGAASDYVATGLAWTGGRSFFRGREVLHFQMPQDENQKFPPMVNMQQYYMEQFLLDAVERRGDAIDLRWQTRVASIALHAGGARLALTTPAGDYALECDWVVGCDGARSLLRETLGVRMQGTTYEGRYVIVDVALHSDLPTERLAWFDPPSNPGSTVLMHKQPDGIWRIDYQLRDDEDPDTAALPEQVIPRVASHLRMIGARDDWAPVWSSIYRANALTLERYRYGRAMLAGDAAHLLPIFGVRGLNSGLDDADNLAWKLALVVRGEASGRLLESYSDERVQAARENLCHAAKSTEFMAPPSFAYALMREAVLTLALSHQWVRSLINPRQTNPIRYVASPLNALPSRCAEFRAGPPAGAVLPECPVMRVAERGAVRGHLTDLLAVGFTLLYFSDAGAIPADLAAQVAALARRVPVGLAVVARSQPDPVQDLTAAWDDTGRLFPMYGASPGSGYLVRPDGHVAARWRAMVAAELEGVVAWILAGGARAGDEGGADAGT